MTALVNVYAHPKAMEVLYKLMEEREPHQNISHQRMPRWVDHVHFVLSRPYQEWWLIVDDDQEPVGAIYVTHNSEIGVGILKGHRREGHAKVAIEMVMQPHRRYLANINPANAVSRKMFESLGFKELQVTYAKADDRC